MRSTHSTLPTLGSAAACVAVAFLGCATADVQPTRAAPEGLPQPSVVLVYDFAVTPADLTGNGRSARSSSKEVELGRATAGSLSEQLVARLQKAGIDASRADDSTPTPLHAVLIQGQFLDVDEGSRLKRVVIGFGAGSSRLEARVQAFYVKEDGIVRIADAEASATGAKTPGMAVPVAGGAVAGSLVVTSAVSGGMNIVRETRAGMDADAGNMAEQIAERIIAYYQRHGWL